jgi:AbrB family looped-hinge helix DNA binding protein
VHPTNFPTDTELCGRARVSSKGQLTIPKEARDAAGIDGSEHVYVFASESLGCAWLVAAKRPGHEIAAFVAGNARDG